MKGNRGEGSGVENPPKKRDDYDNSENGASDNKASTSTRHDFDLIIIRESR